METIFEAGPQLLKDPVGTLETLRALGADRVKIFLPWKTLAPDGSARTRPRFDATDPAAYPAAAFAPYDAIVRDAVARGIGVDVTVSTPPVWAAGRGNNPVVHPMWKPSTADFTAFMEALGRRYSGHYTPPGASSPIPRVRFWSIWNEPNYGPDLAPQAIRHSTIEVSPALYRRLVDAAWNGLHATGHGGDTILIGELAPHGMTVGNSPGGFGGMVPLRFIRALYCVDSSIHPLQGQAAAQRRCPTTPAGSARFRAAHPVLFAAGGFADHPYPLGGIPPNVPVPNEPDYADLATLPKLESLLDQLQARYGSAKRFQIYSTEFGYQTDPPETIEHTTDPVTAAIYLNWSEYISWRDPRIASFDQYQLADSPRANATGGFASGLEFADGRPKAMYAAFRLPIFLPVTTLSRGVAAEVWGCVRPARFVRLDHRPLKPVEIQFEPSGAHSFSTVASVAITDRYGYFDTRQAFARSGSVRLAWSYPHGPTVFSRTVSITVR